MDATLGQTHFLGELPQAPVTSRLRSFRLGSRSSAHARWRALARSRAGPGLLPCVSGSDEVRGRGVIPWRDPRGRAKARPRQASRSGGRGRSALRGYPLALQRIALGVLVIVVRGRLRAGGLRRRSLDRRRCASASRAFVSRMPSRVYSAPAILYPGLDWKQVDLRGPSTASATGRRPRAAQSARRASSRGRVTGSACICGPSSIPSRPEPARDVVLRLRGSSISRDPRDAPAGRS